MSRDTSPQPRAAAPEAPLRPTAPQGLLQTLISFEEAPGRYAVVLREPRMLFDHQLAVMQLAAGRELPEFADQRALLVPARRAARFFVRTVMLKPGADHYGLLGLTPGFEPAQLREHYRLMIRLTHPDFASPDEAWPADAAARINIANDVLGSAVKRREYNEQLAAAQAAAAPKPRGAAAPGPAAAARPKPSVVPRRMAAGAAGGKGAMPGPFGLGGGLSQPQKVGVAAGGAMLVAGLFLWLNGAVDDKGSLQVRELPAQRSEAGLPGLTASLSLRPLDPAAETLAAAPLPSAEPAPETSGAAWDAPTGPSSGPEPTAAPSLTAKTPPIFRPKPVAPPAAEPAAQPAERQRPALARASTTEPATAQASATPAAREVAPWVFPDIQAANAAAPQASQVQVLDKAQETAQAQAAAPEPARPLAMAMASTAAQASPATPALKMSEVQPTLMRIEQAINAGLSNGPLDLIDPAWLDRKANIEFLRGYYRVYRGLSIVRVVDSQFSLDESAPDSRVQGVLRLQLADSNGNTQMREFRLQARFAQKNGKTVLAGLQSEGNP